MYLQRLTKPVAHKQGLSPEKKITMTLSQIVLNIQAFSGKLPKSGPMKTFKQELLVHAALIAAVETADRDAASTPIGKVVLLHVRSEIDNLARILPRIGSTTVVVLAKNVLSAIDVALNPSLEDTSAPAAATAAAAAAPAAAGPRRPK